MVINVNQSLTKAKKFLKQNDIAGAKQIYRLVLESFPKNQRAIEGLFKINALREAENTKNNEPSEAQLTKLINLCNGGLCQQALAGAQSLLKEFPRSVALLNVVGVASATANDFQCAADSYRKALVLNPNFVEGYYNLGTALKGLGDLDGALECYQNAIQRRPDYADALHDMAAVFNSKGDKLAARKGFEKAIEVNPNHVHAYNNLGILCLQNKDFDEAFANATRALEIKPDFAEAHQTIGDIHFEKHELKPAIDSYNWALEINPNALQTHNNLAAACLAHGDRAGAIASYENLLRLAPDQQDPRSKKMHQMAHLCDWSEWDSDLIANLGTGDQEVSPFCLLPLEDAPERHLIRSRTHTKLNYTDMPLPPVAPPKARSERLRIGYFSADVHQHPVMLQLAQVLKMHDRGQFEIYLYGFSPHAPDAMRTQIIEAVDVYDDVIAMRDIDIALLARQDQIDIAIDLNGFTENSRSDIFLHRAAPVQINYLGYPGTMGAEFIDYIIADKNLIPEPSQKFYVEKPIYLPHHYQAQDSKLPIGDLIPSRADLGLPDRAFVFCALSNSYKITPKEFDIWMRLLTKIEGSVLWLLKGNDWVRKNLLIEAAKRGVDPNRLVFAEHTDHKTYLARFKQADLYLDTFIYNAGATASNALWAGLPVLTKRGRGYTARMAASLLTAIELPELITETEAAYEALALALASDPARVTSLKAKLAAHRLTTPLFDTELFTRKLEDGYNQAYDRYFKGEAPDVIDVV
ncbi:MAG: tetratricopeptide repeat protein [Paracoccaceae bacterium]|nr:tetratricopeptide repeat protein [Paracoccaceae bacterium]